jgi:acetyl-CoA carboxylase biotin carboxyl carrier protein
VVAEEITGADNEEIVTKSSKDLSKKTSKSADPSVQKMEELVQLMEDENLSELEISDGSQHIKLVKEHLVSYQSPPPARSASPSSRAPEPKPVEDDKLVVKSPLAGVFYRAPSPKASSFVKEGDIVSPEKTVCIVEAMKVLNEINAGVSGKIVRICVENGKPVQADQTLFVLEPA